MRLGLVALRAVLLQFETIRRVTTVLLSDVVALLANLASEGDLGANVCRLASHWVFLTFGLLGSRCFVFLFVAGAGFEPATSRL